VHSVPFGKGCNCQRSKATSVEMGLSRWGWASCPSSIDRQDACPTRESSAGRDARAYDLVAAGVSARHFLDPGSESGVTNERQSRASARDGPTNELTFQRNAGFHSSQL
jgi:hypothetical protein